MFVFKTKTKRSPGQSFRAGSPGDDRKNEERFKNSLKG